MTANLPAVSVIPVTSQQKPKFESGILLEPRLYWIYDFIYKGFQTHLLKNSPRTAFVKGFDPPDQSRMS